MAGTPGADRVTRPALLALCALGVLALLATLAPANPVSMLGWQREAPWAPLPLIGAHFAHLGPAHLAINLAALAVLGWAAQRVRSFGDFLLALLCAAMTVDAGLILQVWPVEWYVGLSGVLHGGFAWLCLRLTRARGGVLPWLLWIGGLAKALAEMQVPAGSLGPMGFPLALAAHLYGYLGGSAWAVTERLLRRAA
ncbi:rhomboid family intramembrane serine protease [Uliginosibacterium sp. H1]|uniref:rhomboid family intramembrane serine protease n=1 Tax=Uliginosibacterium sp. H1 TaxID=3114757 RepID=UPI002E16B9F0|nr:rhomboid family intramembrane serine protease [Uliginosibacterium sp. H1]